MKILDTILCWIWAVLVFVMFSYQIFWRGNSGWWYLVALLLIMAIRPDNSKEEETNNEKE